MSHDDSGRQAGASPRNVPLSSLVQGEQAQPRSTEASGKVAISVQRDQDQEDYEMEVTMEPKTASSPELCAGEDCFCQEEIPQRPIRRGTTSTSYPDKRWSSPAKDSGGDTIVGSVVTSIS